MNFTVDRVYEDSFYVNMLLGLHKILDKKKRFGVKGRHLTRYPPTLQEEVSAWEKKYGVTLPHELKKFYSATNGFLFKWFFNFGHDKTNLIGKIEVNPLEKLQQIFGYETNGTPEITLKSDRYLLKLGLQSKVFELAPIEDRGKVVLVYITSRHAPSIWFMNHRKNFYYLTDDFSRYFRMMIAHLGIPFWQFRFSPTGPPSWTEVMFRLLAPQLLPFNQSAEGLSRTIKNQGKCGEVIINKLNSDVFKSEYVPTATITTKNGFENPTFKVDQRKTKKEKSKHKKELKLPFYKKNKI